MSTKALEKGILQSEKGREEMFLTPVKEWLKEDEIIKSYLEADALSYEIFERIVNLTTERLTKAHFRAVSKSRSRGRATATIRYQFVKKLRRRADKFMHDSKTPEEMIAWKKIIDWIKSHMEGSRIVTPNGAIGMKNIRDENEG
jgi:hypothetical protein